MSARAISIEAYERHRESGKRLTQWQRIYGYLKSTGHEVTRAELEKICGIRLTSVCGRVKELLDAGLIEERPRRKCRITGEQAHPVRVNRWDKLELVG